MQSPISVLIVDESDVTRSLVARALMRRFRDALVQQCTDRETALHAVRAAVPTVIVAASATGDASPMRLLKELRAIDAGVPILFLTGPIAEKEAIDAGASYVIQTQNWIRVVDVVTTIRRLALDHVDMKEVEFLPAVRCGRVEGDGQISA